MKRRRRDLLARSLRGAYARREVLFFGLGGGVATLWGVGPASDVAAGNRRQKRRRARRRRERLCTRVCGGSCAECREQCAAPCAGCPFCLFRTDGPMICALTHEAGECLPCDDGTDCPIAFQYCALGITTNATGKTTGVPGCGGKRGVCVAEDVCIA